MTKRGSSDGYNTAKIEFISDKPVEGQEEIGKDLFILKLETVP